jgi:hypothetical protein
MTAELQNFAIYEGESKTINFDVTDSEGGSPVNLTGPTSIDWVVKTSATVSTAAISKSLSGGEIALANNAGTNDQIQVTLDTGDSQGMEGSQYYHECKVVDANSKNIIVASGYMSVKHSANN